MPWISRNKLRDFVEDMELSESRAKWLDKERDEVQRLRDRVNGLIDRGHRLEAELAMERMGASDLKAVIKVAEMKNPQKKEDDSVVNWHFFSDQYGRT